MTTETEPTAFFDADLVALLEDERFAGLTPEAREKLAVLLPKLQQAAKADAARAEALRPMVVRGEAVVLQQQAAAKFDEADRLEQRAMLANAVTGAKAALADAESEASRLASAHDQAVAMEREAADKHTAAQEHARVIAELVEDLALADADPAEQTEAILKRNAAEQVAGTFRVKAENAAAQRVQSEASLATARDAVRRAKTALKAAERVADNPPPLTPGTFTLLLDGVRRYATGGTSGWADEHVGQVSAVVEELAVKLGLDRIFANRARREMEDQTRAKAANAFLPKPGHALRPANPGAVFTPVPPRVGG